MDSTVTTTAAGLAATSMWMNAIASNVANMNDQSSLSGKSASGTPAPAAFNPVTVTLSTTSTGSVAASETPVTPSTVATYAPASPDANAQGLVGTPNVDLVTQMTDKTLAMQSYRANVAVIRADNQMTRVTLNMVA